MNTRKPIPSYCVIAFTLLLVSQVVLLAACENPTLFYTMEGTNTVDVYTGRVRMGERETRALPVTYRLREFHMPQHRVVVTSVEFAAGAYNTRYGLFDTNTDGVLDVVKKYRSGKVPQETRVAENYRIVYNAVAAIRDANADYLHAVKTNAFGRVLFGSANLLSREYRALIEGKRVGIVAHNASKKTIDRLIQEGYTIGAIFAPEHGLDTRVEAGVHVEDGTYRGVPVYSLYGGRLTPGSDGLSKIDVLLFELQDVGVRPYTYVSTMYLTMQAAADAGIPYVVLDRPVIIGGEKVEGPMLDLAWQSFIGVAELPNRYGMTVGELALLFKGEQHIVNGILYEPRLDNLALTVVPMVHYNRRAHYDELPGVPAFIPPSPNVRHVEQALCLGFSGLFDGTYIRAGVDGVDELFTHVTLPWVETEPEAEAFLREAYRVYAFPGVRFSHIPNRIGGVKVTITDRRAFSPIEASLAFLYTAKRRYPMRPLIKTESARAKRMFNLGMGSAWLGEVLEHRRDITYTMLQEYARIGVDEFRMVRERYLLYK